MKAGSASRSGQVVAKIVEAEILDLDPLENPGPGLGERCQRIVWLLTREDPITGSCELEPMLQGFECRLIEEHHQ